MAEVPAPETSWESAPGIIDGAMSLQLTAQGCDLDYWIRAVAQGTLAGLVHGHRATAGVPEFMKRPGPLREALIDEMAFRSMAEEKATRAIADLVRIAPGLAEMEFYVTQLFDEARHARVFRGHIVELGVPPEELTELIEGVVDRDRERILAPLEEFAEPIRASDDFIAGVVMLTVLVEGVLAPAAEMSERKWRPLDPAVADIERGACIDEVRHLSVGSSIVRDHLLRHPDEREPIGTLIKNGQRLWESLPVLDALWRRESLFQIGIQEHAEVVGDYEIWPGRRLLDTTPEERITMAIEWSGQMQEGRLRYMGLADGFSD